MKKLFTLVAMAMMAIGANAQAVIAEIDWTTMDSFPFWASSEGELAVTENGLEINVASEGDVYWAPQVQMIRGFVLEELGNYQVQFTAKVASGTCRLDMGSWTTSVSKDYIWDVTDNGDYQDFKVDFPDYPGNSENEEGADGTAFCFIQCGKMVGTTIVKTVKVIDLDADPTGIKSVKNAAANNNVRYNLAGQKVDANYKGVVLQNGKKFIQK